MQKSKRPTLEDIRRSTSKSFAAENPHIFGESASTGQNPAPERPNLALSGKSGTPIAEKVKEPKKKTRTELEYEAMLRREHPDAGILFGRYTFKLSNDCRYTPDFAVVHPSELLTESGVSIEFYRIDFHEVKGAFLFGGATKSATHTSLTKPKLAAENYPWHRWFRATKDAEGNWSREEYRKAE